MDTAGRTDFRRQEPARVAKRWCGHSLWHRSAEPTEARRLAEAQQQVLQVEAEAEHLRAAADEDARTAAGPRASPDLLFTESGFRVLFAESGFRLPGSSGAEAAGWSMDPRERVDPSQA